MATGSAVAIYKVEEQWREPTSLSISLFLVKHGTLSSEQVRDAVGNILLYQAFCLLTAPHSHYICVAVGFVGTRYRTPTAARDRNADPGRVSLLGKEDSLYTNFSVTATPGFLIFLGVF